MKSVKSVVKVGLALACLLVSVYAVAQIPAIDAPGQTDFQAETHFLTFLGSFKPENIASATAYYKAINPSGNKQNFTAWLVNAGFIANASQWHPTGKQRIACDQPGCDLPSHTGGALTYGDNIINTDSHVIVLNAADLGFVRNQFIRCVPSCTAKNPKVYTYLENYPVNAFSAFGNGGTGFPVHTGFPSDAEAAAAMVSAITRPSGKLKTNPITLQTCNDDPNKGTVTTDTGLGCSIARIADVAFEWAPPETNPTSTKYFGQLYAYIFHDFGGGVVSETINWFNDQATLDKVFNSRATNASPSAFPPFERVTPNDPFAPELDFRGVKQMPGVCLICHGGKPQTLTSTGAFPHGGNINGFRFLPIDVQNMKFTSANTPGDPLSQAAQEIQIRQYNKAVLLTVDQSKENDGTGTTRGPHLAEVIKGWYASFPGDQSMSRTTQNSDFVPTGWVGHEALYKDTVATTCRSCHFNREISLDFGTYANFHQDSDMLQLTQLPFCYPNEIDPKARPMPAAHLSYQRYWGNATDTNGNAHIDLPGQIAVDFGFSSTAGYCATGP